MSELTTVNLALPRGRTTTRNGYSADRSGSGSRAHTSPETTSIMPALFRPVTVTGWLACMQCFTFAKSLARICNSMGSVRSSRGSPPHSVKVMTKGHRRFLTTTPAAETHHGCYRDAYDTGQAINRRVADLAIEYDVSGTAGWRRSSCVRVGRTDRTDLRAGCWNPPPLEGVPPSVIAKTLALVRAVPKAPIF